MTRKKFNSAARRTLAARRDLATLLTTGQLVYRNAVQLAELREIVSAWIAELGVEVVFDPETPAGLRDYILGGSLGVVDGAFKGAAIGLFIGALFDAPGTGLIVGAGLGGAVGAAGGVQAISNGHRVRIRAWWADGEPVAVLEAA